MSMWSAPHSGHESVIWTTTDTWFPPIRHRPFHGPSRSTHLTS